MPSLPSLDCHAHVAPEVSPDDVRALGGSIIVAVTRSLNEGERALRRHDSRILWGVGAHPGFAKARREFSKSQFSSLLSRALVVGEVGLDRRAGEVEGQARILRHILDGTADRAVLTSLHSAGCASELLVEIEARPPVAPILHWFTGTDEEVHAALELGCWFSVNAAMNDAQLMRLPEGRVLPETDFPNAKGARARMPGDIESLERRLARIWSRPGFEVRTTLLRNFRTLLEKSEVLDRVPDAIADDLMQV